MQPARVQESFHRALCMLLFPYRIYSVQKKATWFCNLVAFLKNFYLSNNIQKTGRKEDFLFTV